MAYEGARNFGVLKLLKEASERRIGEQRTLEDFNKEKIRKEIKRLMKNRQQLIEGSFGYISITKQIRELGGK